MRRLAGFLLAGGTGIALLAAGQEPSRLRFIAEGKEFRFDTGAFKGTLRQGGKSLGLAPVVDVSSGAGIAGRYGLFSPYRLLDGGARYGTAAWDWASEARLLEDGAVEIRWNADEAHPFDLRAVYRWSAPDTLDLRIAVTGRRDLSRFEVFLASYFAGFPVSSVCAGPGESFVEAKKADGAWHVFPRDEAAEAVIGDGRWKRPPHPVEWVVRPRLAMPLAIRRDPASGLAGILMAPPEDCFAVCTPFGEEGHRSVYLSLFGRDLKAGEPASARARLVLARGVTDGQAVDRYRAWVKELAAER